MAVEDNAVTTPAKTAKGRYDTLRAQRQTYVDRGVECANLTIPGLFQLPGTIQGSSFRAPYQSVGAEGVNNIGAKLMLALFPPGSSCFRLVLDDTMKAELRKQIGGDSAEFEAALAEFEESLGQIERTVMSRIEQKGARMQLFEMFKLLFVTGNHLLQVLPSGGLKGHRLTHYVVKRDSSGNVLELVVLEELDRETLPPEAREIAAKHVAENATDEKDKPAELYTWVKRVKGKWTVCQEVCGEIIPGTTGTYPLDKSPWLPLRFFAVDGEDYGRGGVEERIGDLRSLETLRQALVEGTAICAKVVIGVDESGLTQKKIIAEASNGAVVDGNFDKDVTVLQVEKQADFATALSLHNDIKKDLQRAFLLLSGVQRDAERVTAEEIRAVVAELETALGGFYSTLAQELQRPLVVRLMTQMAKSGELPHLPKGSVEPQIVTGLEGLGRSGDLAKYQAFMSMMSAALGPEGFAASINTDVLSSKVATALAIDIKGLVKSQEQQAQEAQATQQAEMAKAAVGPGIKAMSDQALNAAPTSEES